MSEQATPAWPLQPGAADPFATPVDTTAVTPVAWQSALLDPAAKAYLDECAAAIDAGYPPEAGWIDPNAPINHEPIEGEPVEGEQDDQQAPPPQPTGSIATSDALTTPPTADVEEACEQCGSTAPHSHLDSDAAGEPVEPGEASDDADHAHDDRESASEQPATSDEQPAAGAPDVDEPEAHAKTHAHHPFPIDGYDEMPVREIVPLLADLDRTELRRVQGREEKGQGRSTVLKRIEHLLSD